MGISAKVFINMGPKWVRRVYYARGTYSANFSKYDQYVSILFNFENIPRSLPPTNGTKCGSKEKVFINIG